MSTKVAAAYKEFFDRKTGVVCSIGNISMVARLILRLRK